MNQQNNKNTCMACSCPCEMHKEHNHPVEEMKAEELSKEESNKNKEVKSCSTCGVGHKPDGAPACGCN